MKGTAILIDDNYELQIVPERDANGLIISGLQIGNSLYQNQAIVLFVQPGELKENPVMGVGISDSLLDTDYLSWRQRIRKHLELDFQKVSSVNFSSETNLTIDATYNNS